MSGKRHDSRSLTALITGESYGRSATRKTSKLAQTARTHNKTQNNSKHKFKATSRTAKASSRALVVGQSKKQTRLSAQFHSHQKRHRTAHTNARSSSTVASPTGNKVGQLVQHTNTNNASFFARRIWKGQAVELPATNQELDMYKDLVLQRDYTQTYISPPVPKSVQNQRDAIRETAFPQGDRLLTGPLNTVSAFDQAELARKSAFPKMTANMLMNTIQRQQQSIRNMRTQLDTQLQTIMERTKTISEQKEEAFALQKTITEAQERQEVLIVANGKVAAEYPQYMLQIHDLEEKLETAQTEMRRLDLLNKSQSVMYEHRLASSDVMQSQYKSQVAQDQKVIKKLETELVDEHKHLMQVECAFESVKLTENSVEVSLDSERIKLQQLQTADLDAKMAWKKEKTKLLRVFKQLEAQIATKDEQAAVHAKALQTSHAASVKAHERITDLEASLKQTKSNVRLETEHAQKLNTDLVYMQARVSQMTALEEKLAAAEASCVEVQAQLQQEQVHKAEIVEVKTQLEAHVEAQAKQHEEILESKQEAVVELERKLTELSGADSTREQDHRNMMVTLERLQSDETEKIQIREKEVANIRQQLRDLQSKHDFRVRQVERVQTNLEQLQTEHDTYKAEMKAFSDGHVALQQLADQQKADLTGLRGNYEAIRADRNTLKAEFSTLNKRVLTDQAAKLALNEQVGSLEGRLVQATEKATQLDTAVQGLVRDLKPLDAQLAATLETDVLAGLQLLVARIADSQPQQQGLVEYQHRIQELTVTVAGRESTITGLQSEVKELQIAYDMSMQDKLDLFNENAKMREKLVDMVKLEAGQYDSDMEKERLQRECEMMLDKLSDQIRANKDLKTTLDAVQMDLAVNTPLLQANKLELNAAQQAAILNEDLITDLKSQNKKLVAMEERRVTMRAEAHTLLAGMQHMIGFEVIDAEHEHGCHISNVLTEYIHADRKLRKDDLIESLNGEQTFTLAEYKAALSTTKPGDTIAMQLCRMGTRRTLMLKVMAKHYSDEEVAALRRIAEFDEDDYETTYTAGYEHPLARVTTLHIDTSCPSPKLASSKASRKRSPRSPRSRSPRSRSPRSCSPSSRRSPRRKSQSPVSTTTTIQK